MIPATSSVRNSPGGGSGSGAQLGHATERERRPEPVAHEHLDRLARSALRTPAPAGSRAYTATTTASWPYGRAIESHTYGAEALPSARRLRSRSRRISRKPPPPVRSSESTISSTTSAEAGAVDHWRAGVARSFMAAHGAGARRETEEPAAGSGEGVGVAGAALPGAEAPSARAPRR